MGYAEAGFEVVGVDIERQARYPFPFIRCDVLDMDPRFLATFDVIHASPPCQFATLLKHAPGGITEPFDMPKTVYKCGVCGPIPENEVRGDWRDGYEHASGRCMGAEVYAGTDEAPKSGKPQTDVRDFVSNLNK